MKKRFKKALLVLVMVTVLASVGVTTFAAAHGSDAAGVRSTEYFQIKYVGEAWATKRGKAAWIKYYRNGVYLNGATAYKDSWENTSRKVSSSVTVWDSMNPVAPKTIYRFDY